MSATHDVPEEMTSMAVTKAARRKARILSAIKDKPICAVVEEALDRELAALPLMDASALSDSDR